MKQCHIRMDGWITDLLPSKPWWLHQGNCLDGWDTNGRMWNCVNCHVDRRDKNKTNSRIRVLCPHERHKKQLGRSSKKNYNRKFMICRAGNYRLAKATQSDRTNKSNTIKHTKTYPIFRIESCLLKSLVQIPSLSPLFRMLTTAPQISSLCSSNASPIRHSNCG